MKHLLKMGDLTPDEVAHILDVADELKAQQKAGGTEPLLKGKSVALMFSKIPPVPAPASRWASTSWAASATT